MWYDTSSSAQCLLQEFVLIHHMLGPGSSGVPGDIREKKKTDVSNTEHTFRRLLWAEILQSKKYRIFPTFLNPVPNGYLVHTQQTSGEYLNKLKNIKYLSQNAMLCYAKSLKSCPTLCDPIDGGPPGSPVPGILQERTLEWVAISFSNAWKGKVKAKSLSCVRLLATPWTAGYQAPPSMGFSRQEYWSGVPLPSPSQNMYTISSRSFHHHCQHHCCADQNCLPSTFALHLKALWQYNSHWKWKSLSPVWLLVTPQPIQAMEFSRPEYSRGLSLLQGIFPNPGIEPRSPALEVDSLPAEPEGKPKNTRAGSLSLLQQEFPTQESNQGLLHCRRILYQLSYQGSHYLQLLCARHYVSALQWMCLVYKCLMESSP